MEKFGKHVFPIRIAESGNIGNEQEIRCPETKYGIEVLAAAHPALNRTGEGSSPSDPALLVIR